MINFLQQFQERIEQLRSLLQDAETINALTGVSIPIDEKVSIKSTVWSYLDHLKSSKINRRVQTYVTGIILLYGLFEQYVEEILMAYLEELDFTIGSFNDMPEKIKQSHTKLSAQLLMNRELDKYRERCNEKAIIERMHSCLNDGPFQLNVLAFIDHSSNFRIESLNRFFEPAGIPGMSTRIKQTTAFENYSARKFQNQKINNLSDKIVFADLDDLAWRRNVVAHGWTDETLSIELMKERTDFIRVLGESIYEVLRQSALEHIVKHRCYILPKPLKVFNNSIVCFHLESGSIKKGAPIIAYRSNGTYLEGKITEIEVNHISQVEVIAPPSIDIACVVDFKAKSNYDYFLFGK